MLERRISFITVLALADAKDSEDIKDFSILAKYDDMVQKILDEITDTRYERCFLISVSSNRFKYETVYYVNSNDFNKFREVHEKIILQLGEELPKNGLRLISIE